MTTPTDPILYSFRRCPYAMRARLALAISGLAYALREVKLSAKPPAMLAASPKGTVPVLVLPDGTVIDQSLDIMRWALRNRDPEGWLERDDPEWIALNDGPFKQDLDRYKYPERHGSDGLAHRDNGLNFLRAVDRRLAIAGQLCGSARGLADAAIVPFVRQFAAIDQEWFAAQPLPHLKVWLADHLQSALFQRIMMPFPPWSPSDPPVIIAPSSGPSIDQSTGLKPIAVEDDQALSRTQRRYLRRMFNGRSVPISVGGTTLMTYKEAHQYLLSLPRESRDATYAEMRGQAG